MITSAPESLGVELAQVVGDPHVVQVHVPSTYTGEIPALRITPGSAAEVAEVIRRSAMRGATIYPIGSGARAAIPSGAISRPVVVVSTARLTHILQLDDKSLVVHAQAGLTGRELERGLAPRGLSLGDYPPDLLASSLGGIASVRTPGKASVRHGSFEEAIVGVSAVLADGRSVHTRICPRRSTGPDLMHALCGSEGAIGLITSVVLRIHKKPESRLVASYRLPSIDAAVNASYLALREEASPSGLRIYDAAEAARHFDGLDLPPGHALLCAATAGPTDLAVCDRDLISSAVIAEGGQAADGALADVWWRRLHADEPTPGPRPTLEVMGTPSRLAAVYHAVIAECAKHRTGVSAHISRFGADGAVLFFTIGPVAHSSEASGDITAFAERAAEAAGGWLIGARPTKLDSYFQSLKDALDPHHVLWAGAPPFGS